MSFIESVNIFIKNHSAEEVKIKLCLQVNQKNPNAE